MTKAPTNKELAESILNEIKFEGKTLLEWARLIFEDDFGEVVRCKDCKHYYHRTCTNDFALNLMRENDYCSYGERRSEE